MLIRYLTCGFVDLLPAADVCSPLIEPLTSAGDAMTCPAGVPGIWRATPPGSQGDHLLPGPGEATRSLPGGRGTAASVSDAGEHGGNEFASAADTELVECRGEVFLNGVGRYVQFPDDLAGGVSPDDQGDDTGLRGGQTIGVQQQGADLRRGSGFDHDADLRRGRTAQAGGVQGQPHSGAAAKPDRGGRR